MSRLADIVAGRAQVLHNCWLEGAGADAFGRDAIRRVLDRLGLDAVAHELEAGGCALLVGANGSALFADVIGGEVKRLWVLADAPVGARACARTDVPFDTDLDQRGGSVAFDPADHPDLAPAHGARVVEAASAWLRAGGEGDLRSLRPFVLRAFSDADTAVALIAVYGVREDAPGQIRFNVVAVCAADGEPRFTVDRAGLADALARAWSPVL